MKEQEGTKLGCMSKILVPRHNSITTAKHNKKFKKNINDHKQGGLMGRKERNNMAHTHKPHVPPYTHRMAHYANTLYIKWSPNDTIE